MGEENEVKKGRVEGNLVDGATPSSAKAVALPNHNYLILSFVPLGICLLAFVTIYWSVWMAHQTPGHLPPGMTFPAISLALAKEPERIIGQVGFPLVSLCFLFIFFPFKSAGTALLGTSKYKNTFSTACWASLFGFINLAVVGILPLQDNAVDLMRGKANMEMQSIIHQLAALVFFMCSIYHIQAVLDIMENSQSLLFSNKRPENMLSYKVKRYCLYMLFLPAVISFTLHPSSVLMKFLGTKIIAAADVGGIGQYIAVFGISAYFTSYSLDFHRCYQIQCSRKES
jgi:hypothetical protein